MFSHSEKNSFFGRGKQNTDVYRRNCYSIYRFLWLEFYNDAQFWVPIFSIPFLYLVLDIIVYYVIYVLFLLIFNSIRAASICMVVVTAVFGIFNYELTLFRSMSFIASDIYSFVTAVSVANTYQVQIDVDTAEFL